MKPEELLDAVGEINDGAILDAGKKRIRPWGKLLTAAACLVLVVGGIALGTGRQQPEVPQITQAAAAEEAGPRKFLNFQDCQYAYVGDGASYELPEGLLGEKLGTLEHEIIIGRPDHLHDNGAATFGVGGTIYALQTYDPAFRMAVELDGSYYLCEKTGHLDGSPLDAGAYFAAAGFPEIVTAVAVKDHNGTKTLKTIKGKKAEKLLTSLAQMTPADLTDEQYQQIGEAQRAGDSFLLSLQLRDGTSYEMYVIPSLSIGMLGNDRYLLAENFDADCGNLFAGLEQKPMTTH